MSFETPKALSPEEKAQTQKERTLNDAELLKKGAEYKAEEYGDLRLEATQNQVEDARKEMNIDLEMKNFSEDEQKYYEGSSKIFNMGAEVFYLRNKGQINEKVYCEMIDKVSLLGKKGRAQFENKVDEEGFHKVDKIIRDQYNQKISKEISEAKNFDELIDVVSKKSSFKGTEQNFTTQAIKDIIGRVKNGQLELNSVTRASGLRDVVGRLLENEKKDIESSDENKIKALCEKLNGNDVESDIMKKEERIIDEKESEELFSKMNQGRGEIMGAYQAVIKAEGNPVSRIDMFQKYGGYHPALLKNFLNKYPTRRDFEEFSKFSRKKGFGMIKKSDLVKLADILYKEKEKSENPKNPDVPPTNQPTPKKPKPPINVPEAQVISERELISEEIDPRQMGKLYPYTQSVENYLNKWHDGYPEIGARGLQTKSGAIGGQLIWSDGRMAIFETLNGKISVSFEEIVSPNGKTYGENEENRKREEEERRRRHMMTPPLNMRPQR